MHLLDGVVLSERARGFLSRHATRGPRTSVEWIRSTLSAVDESGHRVPPPEDGLEHVLWFEGLFGGLTYTMPCWANGMEYGIDGDAELYMTNLGWAFYGVLDGSLTAPLDVLADGSIAARLGRWPQRRLDSSIEQRMEKHAMLASVAGWRHRALSITTSTGQGPDFDTSALPAVISEASGPADLWWGDDEVAVWQHLAGWPSDGDRWTITIFERGSAADGFADVVERALAASGASRAAWCSICSGDRHH